MNYRLLASAAFLVGSLGACGGDDDAKPSSSSSSSSSSGSPSDGGTPTCAATPAPVKPTASCEVTIETPPVVAGSHVSVGTPVSYCSNPPSSGPHYPVWAAFQEYSAPLEWQYLVHSMEHGAVVLLYKCEAGGCPEIVDQLRTIKNNVAPDPACAGLPTPSRIILVPSTTIATKVAAAAWGATYQAACVDTASLETFIRDHYAKGPEDFCSPGKVL